MNPIQTVLDSNAGVLIVGPVFLALISLIVVAHELGHFAAAKRFGVTVHTFALGLPPRIWSRLYGAEIICATALRRHSSQCVSGMLRDPCAADLDAGRNALLVYRGCTPPTITDLREAKKVGARAAVLAVPRESVRGLIFPADLDLPVVQVGPEIGSRIAARGEAGDLQAEIRFSGGSQGLESTATLHLGGTRFVLNALPLGGYVQMAGENEGFETAKGFSTKPPGQRAIILIAGPAMNFLLALLLFVMGALIADEVGAAIADVSGESPAVRAGLLPDDRILSIDGVRVTGVAVVVEVLHSKGGQLVELEVQRQGAIFTRQAIPRLNPPDGHGALGIRVRPIRGPASLSLALSRGFERTVAAISLFPKALGEWIGGGKSVQISGPVGIATIVDEATRQGFETVIYLGAFLSAQIGLINLLPWPGLDGGRLVLVGLQWMTGRRMQPSRESLLHLMGIMVLLVIAVIVTVGDVRRLAGM